MYQANFYGQKPFGAHLVGSQFVYTRPDFLAKEPRISDAFMAAKTPFEQQLSGALANIREKEVLLKHKLASIKDHKAAPEIREQIMRDYSMIERTKKWLALLVDQMGKSMQNIAANFR